MTAVPPTQESTPEAWCQKTGLRPTAARRGLFALIDSMPSHFDVEDLVNQCRQRELAVSRATIYRTLPRLCRAGLLRSTEFGDGRHLFTQRHQRSDLRRVAIMRSMRKTTGSLRRHEGLRFFLSMLAALVVLTAFVLSIHLFS